MSDPARDGYWCHGPMRKVRYQNESDEVIAYLCLVCGIWRDGLPVSDPRRPAVERTMTALLACGAWTREPMESSDVGAR